MRPQILVKALNAKLHEHPSDGSRSITYRTDRQAYEEIRSRSSHTTAPKQLRIKDKVRLTTGHEGTAREY